MPRIVEHDCCALDSDPGSGTNAVAALGLVFPFIRPLLQVFKLLTPGALMVLLPKCPLCIVGYAAAAGIGLSVSTAKNLRSGAFYLCVGLLVFFAARRMYVLRRYLPGVRHNL